MRQINSRFQLYQFRFVIIIIIIAVLALPAFGSSAVTGYVRVNQIGYEAGVAMRAYLMTTKAVSGVEFAVTNAA
ncbi:MAG: hypothetical protein WAN60_06800, partial [Candidatus Sulfotelmatobacter sp.]